MYTLVYASLVGMEGMYTPVYASLVGMVGIPHPEVYASLTHPGYTLPAPCQRCTPGYTVAHNRGARRRGPGLKMGEKAGYEAHRGLPWS